jgi:hypothetical protein
MTAPKTGRKTVYNGIGMRSRLEAGFAAWLDKHKFEWEYEPHAFASENGQYLPDFRLDNVQVAGAAPTRVWLEVKPSNWWDKDYHLSKAMAVIYETDTSALRVLQMRGGGPLLHLGVDNWVPLSWVYLNDGHDVRVGLAVPLLEPDLPWPGKFWEAA